MGSVRQRGCREQMATKQNPDRASGLDSGPRPTSAAADRSSKRGSRRWFAAHLFPGEIPTQAEPRLKTVWTDPAIQGTISPVRKAGFGERH